MDQQEKFAITPGKDFVISLQCRSGVFGLFVEKFVTVGGRRKMFYTPDVAKAFRFSKLIGEDVVAEMKRFRCTGRLERVDYQNQRQVA